MHRRGLLAGIMGTMTLGMAPSVRHVILSGSHNGPSLDLNFLAGQFDPRIAFTRASAGWDFDASGNLVQFGTNVPRLGPQGFLVEEQRTNSIRNPRCEGAVAGTPGMLPTNWSFAGPTGLALSVVGSGTESGIPYVDLSISGTPSSTSSVTSIYFEPVSVITASNGQTWTESLYTRLVGGSLTNVASLSAVLSAQTSGGLYSSAPVNAGFTPTSSPLAAQRVTGTGTISDANAASVRPQIAFAFSNTTTAVNLTLRIGLPQLELGAFATSPILPPAGSPAASTRAKDVANVPLVPWFNTTRGTFVVEFAAIRSGIPLSAGGPTFDNTLYAITGWVIRKNAVATLLPSFTGSVVLDGVTTNKAAVAYDSGAGVATTGLNGATNTASVAVPVLDTFDHLALGSSSWLNDNQIDGPIRRIRYWPRALSASELQGVTT